MGIISVLLIAFIITVLAYFVLNFFADTPKELKRIADALERRNDERGGK